METQIESALHWWAALAATPEIGQRARTSRFGRLHRMLLPKTKYHAYYRILEEDAVVQVVLFRQAQKRPLR